MFPLLSHVLENHSRNSKYVVHVQVKSIKRFEIFIYISGI